MPRVLESRNRKSRNRRAATRSMTAEDRLLMRRYLAFVRAIVRGPAKAVAR